MTTVILVQPPPRVDLVEIVQEPNGKLRGRITRPWQKYLDDFFVRSGGNVAPSNDDIAGLMDGAALGVFSPRTAPPADADMGFVRTFNTHVDPVQEPPSVGYLAAFLPRRQEQSAPFADASAVICSRVFSAR